MPTRLYHRIPAVTKEWIAAYKIRSCRPDSLLRRNPRRQVVTCLRGNGFHVLAERKRRTPTVRWRNAAQEIVLGRITQAILRIYAPKQRRWEFDLRHVRPRKRGILRIYVTQQKRWEFVRQERIRERSHPTIWFLAFPRGGCLVIPDCIIPANWTRIRLKREDPYWPWRFFDRFDCLKTYPELPDDLVA